MKTQLFWCFQRVIVAWFYICTVSVGNTIMASVLYRMAHGFYFSDFSSGCNQKNTKKIFFIGANANIIDNNPCLPFSHKKQKTKPKTTKNRKKEKRIP